MERIFAIGQIVLAALLIGAILLQQKGTGLGGVFGGEGNVYRTRRGAERFIFMSTIVLAVLFVGAALASLLVRR